MKTKLFLLLFVLIASAFKLSAQSEIRIMDIVVQPHLEFDSITGLPVEADNEKLNIIFKINNAENAAKTHVLFGTQQDLGDVFTVEAVFVFDGSHYYINNMDEQHKIVGYTAQLSVQLNETQFTAYNYVTLYVEDNQGEISEKLYFVK